LKQLPIHRMGTLTATKSLSSCASIDDDSFLVGPTGGSNSIDPAWLTDVFIATVGSDDETGYDKLGIPKINSAHWYMHHFFPSLDKFNAAVLIAVLQRLLDTFHTFRTDTVFIDFLKMKGIHHCSPTVSKQSHI
jgi:hypothetical protein